MGKMVEALKKEFEVDSVNTIKEVARTAKDENGDFYQPFMSTADLVLAANSTGPISGGNDPAPIA